MLLQKVLMSRPALATKLLETSGKRKAFETFKASLKLPAYKKLLAEANFDYKTVKGFDDFKNIPQMDKSNYIGKYDFSERIKYPPHQNYTVERSSGYSGKPNYWLRASGHDESIMERVLEIFDGLYGIKTKKTLFINTFALGTWVAGVKIARMFLNLSNRDTIPMTTVNTGIKLDEAAEIFMNLSKYYDQTIFAGYNPFLKELIEYISSQGFDFSKHKTHMLVGGEGLSEEWRDYVAGLLKYDIDDFDTKIISGYASTDTGSDIAIEQPITILFRRLLMKNEKLRQQFFGDNRKDVPMMFQYVPSSIWIEEVNGELLFTTNNGMPLVRYNIHDNGGLISYQDMIDAISTEYDIKKISKQIKLMPLPIVYLFGRSDGTIVVSGANVYLEQLKKVFAHSDFQEYITGNFYSYTDYNKRMRPTFNIVLEARDVGVAEINRELITKLFVESLIKMNNEYEAIYNHNPKVGRPLITFISQNEFADYKNDSIKIKYHKK